MFAFSGEVGTIIGMTERKPLPMLPVAILLAVIMLLGAYVIGYFRIGARNAVHGPANEVLGVVRLYPHKWQVTAFRPMAYLESLCIGVEVHLGDYATYGDPYAEETYGTPAYHAKYGNPAAEEP